MSLAVLFHFLCVQHVSDINISIIRSLRLFCWIATLVALFLVRCVLEFRCGWVGVVSVLQASASDIKLVFYSSSTTMMHGPINKHKIRVVTLFASYVTLPVSLFKHHPLELKKYLYREYIYIYIYIYIHFFYHQYGRFIYIYIYFFFCG